MPICAPDRRETVVVLARHSVPERVAIAVMAWGEQRKSPLIASKEHAGRPKDHEALPELYRLRDGPIGDRTPGE